MAKLGELIADRIITFAEIVGQENIISRAPKCANAGLALNFLRRGSARGSRSSLPIYALKKCSFHRRVKNLA